MRAAVSDVNFILIEVHALCGRCAQALNNLNSPATEDIHASAPTDVSTWRELTIR